MSHGSDQFPPCIARQLGVGIERDHVFYVVRYVVSPEISEKASVVSPRRKSIQVASLPRLRS